MTQKSIPVMTRILGDHAVMWWDGSAERWIPVDPREFARAGNQADVLDPGEREGPLLTSVPAGDHRFMFLVIRDGICTNFIAHRYDIDATGRICGRGSVLSPDEKAELKALYEMTEHTTAEAARVQELLDREFEILRVPAELLNAFVRDLPFSPPAQAKTGFWAAIREHGGHASTGHALN